MKIRLLLLTVAAITLVGFGLSLAPQEATASVPCHECPSLYDACATEADHEYSLCIAGGGSASACSAQRQSDLDACDLAEGACFATCFECEFEGEGGWD